MEIQPVKSLFKMSDIEEALKDINVFHNPFVDFINKNESIKGLGPVLVPEVSFEVVSESIEGEKKICFFDRYDKTFDGIQDSKYYNPYVPIIRLFAKENWQKVVAWTSGSMSLEIKDDGLFLIIGLDVDCNLPNLKILRPLIWDWVKHLDKYEIDGPPYVQLESFYTSFLDPSEDGEIEPGVQTKEEFCKQFSIV